MTAPTLELWLVRHGETIWTSQGLLCGSADPELTERGREQAAALNGVLRAAGPFDGVWSSPRTRARQTAALAGFEPRIDERLAEFDFGRLEGLAWEELDEATRTTIAQFRTFAAPDGDDVDRFRRRVCSFVDELPPGRHLCFAHVGVIRILVPDRSLRIRPASVLVATAGPGVGGDRIWRATLLG